MSNSYQLRSHPDKPLFEHLKSVALATQEKIEAATLKISTNITLSDLERCAFIIGATHDIGKGTTYFQRYLPPIREIPLNPLLKSHSLISSLYCSWVILNDDKISGYRQFLAMASALAIQAHHGSLKRPTSYVKVIDNFYDEDVFAKQVDSFESIHELERISKDLGICSFTKFIKAWDTHFYDFRDLIVFPSYIIEKIFMDNREPYFLINLLYSCLLDADRLDVAGLPQFPERITKIKTDSVTSFVKNLTDDSSEIIRKLRNTLFDSIQQQAEKVSLTHRIFTFTAATGLGKTLASMNFALNLRRRIQLEKSIDPRIIYVAPFISILDQNWKELQRVFQTRKLENGTNNLLQQQTNLMLIHHHLSPIDYTKADKSMQEQLNEKFSTSQSELLIQGWNSEIVVTTFIQFFDTIFGRYPSQLRRLHNLIGSIVILDEAQSVPFEYWEATRNVLLFLAEKFQLTIILMTATQPLIFRENEAKEIAPISILNSLPQRVTFEPRTILPLKINEFCAEVKQLIYKHQSKSVLIEMNTISTAIHVYNSIMTSKEIVTNRKKIFFLSSQIIAKYRGPRIDDIKQRLERSENIVLISTQVIEAGVNLDFDVAIRDIGPIDSIVQAAGRCNRNGKRKARESPFYVYRVVNENGYEFARDVYKSVSIEIANSLINENDTDLINLVQSYYEKIRKRRSCNESYDINKAIPKLNYEEVDEAFELINQFKIPVFVEFDRNAIRIWERYEIFVSKESEKPTRNEIIQIRHEMEQYLIAVTQKQADKSNLVEKSGIYRIAHEDIDLLYNETTGFIPQGAMIS